MNKNDKNKMNQERLFSPKDLKLSQNFNDLVRVKKAMITIPVRKPGRQDFIRVRPEEEYRLETAVLELKEERETYLVAKNLWDELAGELIPKVLFTAINRQNVLFLWPIRLPGEDGRIDQWNDSALEAAKRAMNSWIRVSSNIDLGAYEVLEAKAEIPEPKWPDIIFQEILKIAFKDRLIDSLEHQVIKRLKGIL